MDQKTTLLLYLREGKGAISEHGARYHLEVEEIRKRAQCGRKRPRKVESKKTVKSALSNAAEKMNKIERKQWSSTWPHEGHSLTDTGNGPGGTMGRD